MSNGFADLISAQFQWLYIFIADNIPDETKALRVAAPMSTVAGMLPPTKEWPSNVVNMVCALYWSLFFIVFLSCLSRSMEFSVSNVYVIGIG